MEYAHLNPKAAFIEQEGLTLVLPKSVAERESIPFEGIYQQITLSVHSSLEAVGLTAAVSRKLATKGIGANVIAAYFHDHIFIQSEKAKDALAALLELKAES